MKKSIENAILALGYERDLSSPPAWNMFYKRLRGGKCFLTLDECRATKLLLSDDMTVVLPGSMFPDEIAILAEHFKCLSEETGGDVDGI